MTMREDLADWCDWDVAALSYGIAIGVFADVNRSQVTRTLLSANPLGDGLHAGMLALVEAGVVERREEPDEQFRWVFAGVEAMPANPFGGSGLDLPELTDLPEPVAEQPSRHWWQRG